MVNKIFVRISRIAAWASQGLNVAVLQGHHNQTVSARCYVNRHQKVWQQAYWIINALFWFQDDHCKISYERDIFWAKDILEKHQQDVIDDTVEHNMLQGNNDAS